MGSRADACRPSACAKAPGDPAARAALEEADDPIAPASRSILAATQFVDCKPDADRVEATLAEDVAELGPGQDGLGAPAVSRIIAERRAVFMTRLTLVAGVAICAVAILLL